jgi:S-formylglutathione hydrolase FrmB
MLKSSRMAGALAVAWLAATLAPAAAVAAAAPASRPNVWKFYIVQSPSTGKIERFWVGHPAALKPGGKYPVLYFLPGLLDGDDTWKTALDPHLAKYEIIAVCPAVGGASWFMNSPAQPWMRWGDFLTEDLRAFVESRYPAAREKGQRGIAGISAGGHGAFYNALARPDLYGSVSVLSGAMELRGYRGAVGLDRWIGPATAEALPLYAERSCVALAEKLAGPLPFALFLDSGDSDGALQQMDMLRKVLDAKQAAYQWFVGKGGHNWTYWTSRADDHLAWFADQFARNRREGRFTDVAPPKAADLKILARLPDVALSEEAARRLAAPWTHLPAARPVPVTGLPASGGPLSKTDEKYKRVSLNATLSAGGHATALYVYRLMLTVSTPLARAGTVSLATGLRNGRSGSLLGVPTAAMMVPEGPADRRVELRARLVVELKTPDPLRGGIVAGLQVFDADGRPVGEPLVGQAPPGSVEAEQWTVAPQATALWTLMLEGDKALPLAAVHEVRLEVEP